MAGNPISAMLGQGAKIGGESAAAGGSSGNNVVNFGDQYAENKTMTLVLLAAIGVLTFVMFRKV